MVSRIVFQATSKFIEPIPTLEKNMAHEPPYDAKHLKFLMEVKEEVCNGTVGYPEGILAYYKLPRMPAGRCNHPIPLIFLTEMYVLGSREPIYATTEPGPLVEAIELPLNVGGTYVYDAAKFVTKVEQQSLIDFYRALNSLLNVNPANNSRYDEKIRQANFYLQLFAEVPRHFGKESLTVDWNFDPITGFCTEMVDHSQNRDALMAMIGCMQGKGKFSDLKSMQFSSVEPRCMSEYSNKFTSLKSKGRSWKLAIRQPDNRYVLEDSRPVLMDGLRGKGHVICDKCGEPFNKKNAKKCKSCKHPFKDIYTYSIKDSMNWREW